MHWLDKLDIGTKIVTFAAGLLGAVLSYLGIRTWLANRRVEAEAKRQEQLNTAVSLAVQGAIAEAEVRARAAYVEGARQEQANMLTLMEWTRTHEDSDESRFSGLHREIDSMRSGQHETHGMLREMGKALAATREDMGEIRGFLKGINDREHRP